MPIHLFITQADQKDGQLEKVKIVPAKGFEPMTAVLTPEEVVQFIDGKNMRLWTNVIFWTIVKGTSQTAEVKQYSDKHIRSLANDTGIDIDNLLCLPRITLEGLVIPLNVEGLKNWLQRQVP